MANLMEQTEPFNDSCQVLLLSTDETNTFGRKGVFNHGVVPLQTCLNSRWRCDAGAHALAKGSAW